MTQGYCVCNCSKGDCDLGDNAVSLSLSPSFTPSPSPSPSLSLSHSPMMSGPGFLSTSPKSRISSISTFVTDCKEVGAMKPSNEKRLLELTRRMRRSEAAQLLPAL